MATHFAKYLGIKANMRTPLTKKYIEKMIVREPKTNIEKMHPRAKQKWNQMTQEPKPLTYKLQDLPEQDTTLQEPLGLQEAIPFQVSWTS